MPSVEFFGEQYEIADRIGLMPLMRFAKVAKAGTDADDMEGLAAMYDLIEQAVADSEWQRFQDAADKNRASGDELMTFVSEVIEVLSKRPTVRPSSSLDGPTATVTTLTAGGSVKERLEQQGRADLAVFVKQAGRSA